MSAFEFPTYIVKGHGQKPGHLVIGHLAASKEVPDRFKGEGCRLKKVAGNWRFSRPLAPAGS